MAKKAGRTLLIKKASTVVAGVRSLSYKVGREYIDVTDNDSGIFREFLADAEASASISLKVSGLSTDEALKDAGFSVTAGGGVLNDVTITDPTSTNTKDVLSGTFVVTNFEVTAEYQGAIEFSCDLESSGAWARA